MDDFASVSPNPEVERGLLKSLSLAGAGATTSKKSVRISTPNADKAEEALANNVNNNSAVGRIQTVVENGLVKKVSKILTRTIDSTVGKNPSDIRQPESQISNNSSLLARPSSKQKKKSSSLAEERFTSKPPWNLKSSRNNEVPKEYSDSVNVKSSIKLEVQPLGDHVLLKRLTANSEAINPVARSAVRTISSLGPAVVEHGQPKRFSSKAIPAINSIESSSSDRSTSSAKRTSLGQPAPVGETQQRLLKKFSAKAIDAAVRFSPAESSSVDQSVADPRLLKKFSVKAIGAAVRFTDPPSERSRSAATEAVIDHGFLEDLSAKTIDGAVRSAPIAETSTKIKHSSSSYFVQPVDEADDGLLHSFSPEDSLVRFNPSLGPESISSSSSLAQSGVSVNHEFLEDFSATSIDGSTPILETSAKTKQNSTSSFIEPVDETDHGLVKRFSPEAIDNVVRFNQSLGPESTSLAQPAVDDVDHGFPEDNFSSVRATDGAIISPSISETSAKTNRSSSTSSSFILPVVDEADHGLVKRFSPEDIDAAVRANRSLGQTNITSSNSLAQPATDDVVHGLLKNFSPKAINAAVRRTRPSSEKKVDNVDDLRTELQSELIHSSANVQTLPLQKNTLGAHAQSSNSSTVCEVKVAPPKLFGPRAKAGGILYIDEPKAVKICVLGVCDRVLYLEVYKDFVDLLLNFLTMRTGAVIKLLREVDLGLELGGHGGGILNVYNSLSKLNESMLTTLDKDLLLDPIHKLNLTRELKSLDSFEPECCNAECPKYMSSSRLVCQDCTISNHFSCSICNAYFRDNLHTTMCYTPWKPWGTHVSAAPVLNRYTVVQSISSDMPSQPKKSSSRPGGFVKNGVPFMITNDLNISPLTTRSIATVLKSLDAQDGRTGELDCHELLIGKTEVVFLLGAAMTSLTPLTDVFAHMCKSENKISATKSLTLSQELVRRASSIAKPLEDLMTYVRPLAVGLVDAVQQGTEAAVKRFSESQQGPSKHESSNFTIDGDSQKVATKKKTSSSSTQQNLNPQQSPTAAIRKKSSLLPTPQSLIPQGSPPAMTKRKSSSIATTQDLTQTLKAAGDDVPPSPGSEKRSLSVAKPRGSVFMTGQALDLQPETSQSAESSRQTTSFTSGEIEQEKLQEDLRGDQPSTEVTELKVSRKSSGIVQHKSIFLPPEENEDTDEESSSITTSRPRFFDKFFSSRVVKAPKEKKKRRGWFKLFSPKLDKPLPDTRQPPTLGEKQSSQAESSERLPQSPLVGDRNHESASLGSFPTQKSKMPIEFSDGDQEDEEQEDEAEATTLSQAVAPNERSLEEFSLAMHDLDSEPEEGSSARDNFSSDIEIMEDISFQPVKIETEFPTGGFE